MSGLPNDPGLPPEVAKHVRHPKYVVLYSPSLGVYLGDGRWSFTNGQYRDKAPVLNNEGRPLTDKTVKDFYPDAPADATLYEVHPSFPAAGATKDECANVGLPRWY